MSIRDRDRVVEVFVYAVLCCAVLCCAVLCCGIPFVPSSLLNDGDGDGDGDGEPSLAKTVEA